MTYIKIKKVSKKWLYLIIPVIIILGLLQNFIYYSSYNEALKDAGIKVSRLKMEIANIEIPNHQAIIYLTQQDRLTIVLYKIKQKENNTKYRVDNTNTFYQDIDTIKFDKLIIKDNDFFNQQSSENKIILSGIRSNGDVYKLKVKGMSPTVREFDLEGKKYYLWYIVGGEELDSISEKDLLE